MAMALTAGKHRTSLLAYARHLQAPVPKQNNTSLRYWQEKHPQIPG